MSGSIRPGEAGDAAPRDRIAGVELVDLGEAPPGRYRQLPGFTDDVTVQHAYAREAARRINVLEAARGGNDPRIARLSLQDEAGQYPPYSFVVTEDVLGRIQTLRASKGAEPSQNELLKLCLEASQYAVDPDFSPSALNAVNASFYDSRLAFNPRPDIGAAALYGLNEPFNRALGRLLALEASDAGASHLRVKELCCGSNVGHWNWVGDEAQSCGIETMDVVLSDFVPRATGDITQTNGLSASSEEYSLFNPLRMLPPHERFGAIVTTYGFDSVWLPGDMALSRHNDRWFSPSYRVKVADWHPDPQALLTAMRERRAVPDARIFDYDGIALEKVMLPFDLDQHPYGSYIRQHGKDEINFPGGLIDTMVQAFDKQLRPDGVFVSADIADYGQRVIRQGVGFTGIAGLFRIDDYELAEQILSHEHGLNVTVYSLHDLAERYLPEGWQAETSYDAVELDSSVNDAVLIARRA